MRIAVPAVAVGLAAAVTGALLMSSASAATVPPKPTVAPSRSGPSNAELEKRVADAATSDSTLGGEKTASTAGTAAGTKQAKIIGGSTTTISTAPFMAQLWYSDTKGTTATGDDVKFFCGGTVIAPTKILTASHCVKGYNWKAHGVVVTGTATLPDAEGKTNGTLSGVWRQWNNPAYNATTFDNDIAVLTLDYPVKAAPLRMTTSGDTTSYKPLTNATVYGWGRTSSTTQATSQTLKTATLPIQSDATCTAKYRSGYVKGHMVCAGKPATGSDTGTTTTCNGDSGGPLVVGSKVVGVVSWGVTNCVEKGAYSVFTKVTSYVGAVYPRVEDANLSGDQLADLWLRRASTKVGYERDSKGTSFAASISWGNWDGVNVVLQTDLNRDDYQDLVLRDSISGAVYWMHYVPKADGSAGTWATKTIFANWKTRTRIITPGDVTGDYKPDILSVDSGGALWVYPGNGDGTFGSPFKVSTGWNQYNSIVGHGDFNGDGKADLLARAKTGSAGYLIKGNGRSGTQAFAARVRVRTWDAYNTLVTPGDVTGDGKADFLARTVAGKLYLYPGTGKGTSEIFGTPKVVGTDYKQFDIIS
ncbi:trypsin-like serine protease [Streptomyces sp. ME02-8801-2C]|uniref:trypsin-like serine protease n=1 Tax=Streptomyces sp. ME02-8801-2C TaxID=3028680 RepID=UPI0029AAC3D4|nr:trypsin-like serine protease [Streptomyces sp. ME02-8801-2C]MDX3457147.1 trypsin-like serine protease [Streptomyces sp. ME02-8801-2C]